MPFQTPSTTSQTLLSLYTSSPTSQPSNQLFYYSLQSLSLPNQIPFISLSSLFSSSLSTKPLYTDPFHSEEPLFLKTKALEGRREYLQALDLLKEGILTNKDQYCYMGYIRLAIESNLDQNSTNYKEILDYLLENLIENGIFNCYIPEKEQLYPIYQFYLYLDISPGFRRQVLLAIKEGNQLVKFL